MRVPGALMQRPQHFQFGIGRGLRLGDVGGEFQRPTGRGGHLLRRHAGMEAGHRQLLGHRIGFHDAEIGDDPRGALGGDALLLPIVATLAVTKRGHEFELVHGSIGTARAFDNKVGAYIVGEALIRLSKDPKKTAAKIVAVGTAQEGIGTRGAIGSGYSVDPQVALVVDVGHATDHPDCDNRKYGETKLGAGPMICRGPNINHKVFDGLVKAAKKLKIPYQVESDPRPTGTDARAIQVARGGVATGVVSIPLRYMHTPSEIVDLEDVERCVKLFAEFARGITKGDYRRW